MLCLNGNEIRYQGAQYLARALENNRVKHILYLYTVFSPCSFNLDAHNAESLRKHNW